MTLALTGECNMRCRYCYQNAKSGVCMPWPVIEAAADRLLHSTAPCVEMVFAGGEPLVAFDLMRRAVEYTERHRPRKRKVRYHLATNGTLLGPETIAFLRRHDFEIELSFDGVLPAQAVRGKRSFARVDEALDRLCDDAPELFWRRLKVGVTLDADAVPCLSASVAYLLEKDLQAISISPAIGQAARWTPRVLATLRRELKEVFAIALRRYEATGQVPLAAFRKIAGDAPDGTAEVCGAPTPNSVTVDLDGEVYACPMMAESSQRFANQLLAAAIQPLRIGHVADPAFWERLADLPRRARATRMFHVDSGRYSLHGSCDRCPYRFACRACPMAALAEPEHDDVLRVPGYVCAFNRLMGDLRARFPLQPDGDVLLARRARKYRLVHELLKGTPLLAE